MPLYKRGGVLPSPASPPRFHGPAYALVELARLKSIYLRDLELELLAQAKSQGQVQIIRSNHRGESTRSALLESKSTKRLSDAEVALLLNKGKDLDP